MKLEEKLISLSEYGVNFRTYKNNFIVSVTFKDGWSVIKPSDDKIKFIKDKEKQNTYYYATEVSKDTTHLEGIFSNIEETIDFNKELEEKTILLKEKIDELSQLFVDTPISKLKQLEFTFPSQKKKTSSTRVSKKKKEEKNEETTEKQKKKEESVETDIDKKIKMSMEKVNKRKQQTK